MLRVSKRTWLMAVLSAALQVLTFPSPSLSFLSWIAFVPLLWVLIHDELRPVQAFTVAYLCGVLWYAGTCFWIFHTMHVYGNLSAPIAAGVLVLFCLYLGIYHGVFGLLVAVIASRGSLRLAIIAAPALWVAVELARYHITGFPWDLLGTAVVDNVPLSRIATVTGVYGLSFVVLVANAAIASGLLWRVRTVVLAAIVVAAAMQALSLYQPPPSHSTHSALLVQQNLPIEKGTWSADHFDRTMGELTALSRRPAHQRGIAPGLIIWPESPAPFYMNDQKFRSWISTLAADQNSYVITGTLGITGSGDAEKIFNSAALIAPGGNFVARYDKIRLVPFGEYVPAEKLLFFAESLVREVSHFSRGNERNVLDLGADKAGIFICYESIFPDEVRQFALHGAQLFVNISNDEWFGPYGAPGQHLNMARMRAIENNRWVLRSTNSGVTASIDPYGRVVARAPRHVRTTLEAPYAFVSDTTLYTRFGDWFAYVCAIISLIALFSSLRSMRRPR